VTGAATPPGQTSGTALASVLFGNTDPGGHLPVTFPRNLPVVKFTVQPPLYAPNTSSVLYATVGLGGPPSVDGYSC
jgi:hypothetical protein